MHYQKTMMTHITGTIGPIT
jgi:hypothetical protein